jgi:predicted O-linked N-acetylglucosamine transferase (SPINDLY family)
VDLRKAQDIEALAAQAEALYQARKFVEAESVCRRLVSLLPDHPMVHYNLARVLKDLGRMDAAIAAIRKTLALTPAFAEAWLNLGTMQAEAGRWTEAAESFERGLAAKPGLWPLLSGLGRVRLALGQRREAEALFRQALALAPDAAAALVNLGSLVLEDGAAAEAEALFQRALAVAPTMPEALMGAGNAARKAGDRGRSLDYYERAVAARPDDLSMRARLVESRLGVCDWRDVATLRETLVMPALASGRGEISPRLALGLPVPLSPAEQLAFARCRAKAVADEVARLRPEVRVAKPGHRRRLRIGYLSADFHDHPTTHLMRGLFPHHDRSKVEVVTLALDADDGSDYRRFVREHSDRFIDLAQLDTVGAVRAIAEAKIDILVDINVHTSGNRLQITACKPAPVTVNWLGLPGSSGAAFMDYALVDPVVVPPGMEADFSERLVVMPHSYQPNDRDQEVAAEADCPPRAECGLPEGAFVFCCFNQAFKIEPQVFSVWMRLLAEVPGSVLWLLAGAPEMVANLRREAAARGIDPDRLVFGPRMPKARHLARHRHADLFLDTLFYNAHTTASDALWAGVPVVTTPGRAFPSRVAASLLRAVGLSDLVCPDIKAYHALALRLATDRAALAGVKTRLLAQRLSTPLFDTSLFVRTLEAAYALMWKDACSGIHPRRIDVPAS